MLLQMLIFAFAMLRLFLMKTMLSKVAMVLRVLFRSNTKIAKLLMLQLKRSKRQRKTCKRKLATQNRLLLLRQIQIFRLGILKVEIMLPKIENRAYHYQGNNVCAVSATLNIYADDGVTIVASTGLHASYNISQPDYVAEITRQINQQVDDYLAKLAQLDAMRTAIFPDSTDFAAAVDMIFDPIQLAIGG